MDVTTGFGYHLFWKQKVTLPGAGASNVRIYTDGIKSSMVYRTKNFKAKSKSFHLKNRNNFLFDFQTKYDLF